MSILYIIKGEKEINTNDLKSGVVHWLECYSQCNCCNCNINLDVNTYLVSKRLIDVDMAAHKWLFLFVGVPSESYVRVLSDKISGDLFSAVLHIA